MFFVDVSYTKWKCLRKQSIVEAEAPGKGFVLK